MKLPFAFSAAFALVALVASATGCSSSASGGSSASQLPNADLPPNLLGVPVLAQQTDYSGGDVATLSVLRYWQPATYNAVPEGSLYVPLQTTMVDGTEPYAIAAYVNALPGMAAQYRSGDVQVSELLAAIDAGQPVIVDLQAWPADARSFSSDYDDGHFAVLVGYDAVNLFFMDTSTSFQYAYVPRAELESRWHDVVGNPGVATTHPAIFVQSTGTPVSVLPEHVYASYMD